MINVMFMQWSEILSPNRYVNGNLQIRIKMLFVLYLYLCGYAQYEHFIMREYF